MNILYIVSTLERSGPTNVLYNLISNLNRQEFTPIILTLSKDNITRHSLQNSFKQIGVEILSLNLSRLSGFFKARNEIKKIVLSNCIDIIHINGFRGDFILTATSLVNPKIISTINSNIFDDYTMLYGGLKGKLMAYLHMSSLKGKSAIACSNFVAEQLYNRYNRKLEVIYNGIPKETYRFMEESEKSLHKQKLGIPDHKKIFLFVGHLIHRKDPETVIKAFINTQEVNNSILLIVGDGPLMDTCKQTAMDHPNIIFAGAQSETLRFLNASDYYISSAVSEGLPTSVMEAMGCGLPIILSNIKPHQELIASMGNWQYTFPINDVETLAKLIDSIHGDNYEKLSKLCRNVIENTINAQIMAKNYQMKYLTL